MSSFNVVVKITVTTVNGEECEHRFPYATREQAEAGSSKLLADIMEKGAGGGGMLLLGNPPTIYVVDNVISIKEDIVVRV